jgi:DNA repair exonuclease SbcCD ATPase subunit
MYEHLEKHFSPSGDMISYLKLRKFVKHQINEYERVQKDIESNTSYYLLKEPKALEDYAMLQDKLDEWQWFLDSIIDDELRIKIITI